jgi:hypothetical protein
MGAPAEMKSVAFMQGDWDVDVSMKMDPAGDWIDSKGSATTTLILDGCVQKMEFEGTMMGMPFKGQDMLTYNRETQKFESFWVDSMSAHVSMNSGGWDGEKFVMTGRDVMMGQPYLMRTTMEKVSDSEVSWAMETSLDEGKTWFKSMKMVYKRKTS